MLGRRPGVGVAHHGASIAFHLFRAHDSTSTHQKRCVSTAVLEGVLCIYVLCTWCVCWGDFVDPPTYSMVNCMCFQAVKGSTIVHTALCPPTASPMSLSWLPVGITVTSTRSNGDTVPVTVISASKCGQYMSLKQPRNQGMTFSPSFVPTRRALRAVCARCK